MDASKQLAVLVILLVGVQMANADLDDALQAFLSGTRSKISSGSRKEAVKELFNVYKTEMNRNGQRKSDDRVRFNAFNHTLSVIVEHYRHGDQAFTLGLNEYSDWTPEELAQMNGVRVPEDALRESNTKQTHRLLTWRGTSGSSRSTPPASYDYTSRTVSGTNVPVVLPVKQQGGCGSCYAFALATMLEFQYAIQLTSNKALSDQQFVDCSSEDNGCRGGYITRTFDYLRMNTWQVDSQASYPYKERAGTCAFKGPGGGGVKFGSLVCQRVTANSASAMQQALVDYGPLWVSFFAGAQTTASNVGLSTAFGSYKSGIFQVAGCPTDLSSTNHAVVIVGYGVDAATNIPYWKVRNSWGAGWGDSGYFRIRRGVNMCGIESGPYYIARSA